MKKLAQVDIEEGNITEKYISELTKVKIEHRQLIKVLHKNKSGVLDHVVTHHALFQTEKGTKPEEQRLENHQGHFAPLFAVVDRVKYTGRPGSKTPKNQTGTILKIGEVFLTI